MPFEKAPQPKPNKWEVVYEDEDCISIWKYDKKKSPYGPVEVEYKYKKGFVHPSTKSKKTIKDIIAEEKKKNLQ